MRTIARSASTVPTLIRQRRFTKLIFAAGVTLCGAAYTIDRFFGNTLKFPPELRADLRKAIYAEAVTGDYDTAAKILESCVSAIEREALGSDGQLEKPIKRKNIGIIVRLASIYADKIGDRKKAIQVYKSAFEYVVNSLRLESEDLGFDKIVTDSSAFQRIWQSVQIANKLGDLYEAEKQYNIAELLYEYGCKICFGWTPFSPDAKQRNLPMSDILVQDGIYSHSEKTAPNKLLDKEREQVVSLLENMARFYVKAKQPGKAVPVYFQLINYLEPPEKSSSFLSGILEYLPSKARDESLCRQASMMNNLGQTFTELNQLQYAKQWIVNALNKSSRLKDSNTECSECYKMMNDSQDAKRFLSSAKIEFEKSKDDHRARECERLLAQC